jgi:CRP-like cAMP-binding protein
MPMTKNGHLRRGERTNPAGKPVGNKILLAMPDEEYLLLRPYVEFVELPHRQSLHEPNAKLEFLYFPNRGMLSLVIATEEGRTVEVGIVGNEGLAGTPSVAGLRTSPLREMVQISGDGFRVHVNSLEIILKSAPELQKMLYRHAVLQGLQVAQTAACNRLHKVEQRLARWLLMTQDRVDDGMLPISHDFLAMMLGTDRPSVTLAAGVLQERKMIRYIRGAVKILNRKRLEAMSCECYGIIQQFNGHLGIR